MTGISSPTDTTRTQDPGATASGRTSGTATQRLAVGLFLVCCLGYLAGAMGPMVARAATGQGWSWQGDSGEMILAAATFAFPLVGVLVARRQPANPIGWILLSVGLLASLPTAAYLEIAVRIRPGLLPAPEFVAAVSAHLWAPLLGVIATFLILLFPDGHLPSPSWRPVAWFAAFAIVWVYVGATLSPGPLYLYGVPVFDNPLGMAAFGEESPFVITLAFLPLSFLLCAAGLVVRFRRASGTERLQLKWLATASAVFAGLYAIAMVVTLSAGGTWEDGDPTWMSLLQALTLASFALIPAAIGVAILKHNLYEIDVVINKAVVLAVLAAFITSVYVVIVVGVGHLVSGGDEPSLAWSIAATALIAVAFQPVREWVQRFANRLVYGQRATPYDVVSGFADRLAGGYDAAALLGEMARTVGQGVGASRVEIWLVAGSRLVQEASWPDPAAAEPGALDARAEPPGDAVVQVRHSGELLGVLAVTKPPAGSLGPVETRLLDDVAAQAGLVLRNVRLIEDLRGSRERLVTSQDGERRRLERALHDGAQRRLASVSATLAEARRTLDTQDAAAAPALDMLVQQVDSATAELGELARGIHPAVLTERGLDAALGSLAERATVPVQVDVHHSAALSPTVEATLYFVAAEALTNIAKYASATAVQLGLFEADGSVVLEVSDDGIGGADEARGSGIRGLRDRVAAVAGTLELRSPASGGTRLRCAVPLSSALQRPDRAMAGSQR